MNSAIDDEDEKLLQVAEGLSIDLSGVRTIRLNSRPVYLNEMRSNCDFQARAYFRRESDGDQIVMVAYGDSRDSAYAKLSANLDLYSDYELTDLDG